MKKKLFLLAAVIVAGASTLFSQDTIPVLTIDSTLTVGDSATFNNNVRVEGNTTLRGDVDARTFTVHEDALFEGNVTTLGNMFYPNAPAYTGDLEDMEFFVKNPENGQIEKSGLSALETHFYSKQCAAVNGVVENPFWNSAPNELTVACPEVRVGIGTEDPSHSLHVVGSTLMQSSLQAATVGVGGEPSNFSRFRVTNANYGAAIEANNTGNNHQFQKLILLQYDNPATEIIKVVNTETGVIPFFFEANGHLSIHNGDMETFRLQPDGLLYGRAAILDMDEWPDFAFDEGYELPPLQTVRDYVAANNHLPHFPPAARIEDEGLNVAETQRLTTLSLEELYLYVFQLEDRVKEIDMLKARIAELEALEQRIKALEALAKP